MKAKGVTDQADDDEEYFEETVETGLLDIFCSAWEINRFSCFRF